ncbi:hypothetical protein S40285_10284 [Stachybotrys chlorohalonatus IBT 40285]|uniref:Uncharacterized protein n=1 Tax=Stachybotrys chlorohalonatus (strain IBT 40285) TaxID=1283841 RepID=A0A084QFA1_STAC4|nr:hypothetical protein S40285_10284 [Stachybotrys chlorohalonata IBT 40285]
MRKHVWKELYPHDDGGDGAAARHRPDAAFGRSDCEVLAAVESRYQRSKWLEMQANFFNVTGRLVPLEAIRAKCERADDDALRERVRREGETLLRRVEAWVKDVQDEEQSEPEA